MRLTSKNGKEWISKSIDKLHNYLDRAPVLVSDIVGTENCKDGVFIIHESTKDKMFFPFDYDVESKAWVYGVKEKLLTFYPRIVENVTVERASTPAEMAEFVMNGGDPSKVPPMVKDVVSQRLWRIDKVQLHKDLLILQLEGTRNIGESDWSRNVTPIQNRYKFQGGCSVMYLTKYRNGDFLNQVEAGEYFFENSIFIDELQQK